MEETGLKSVSYIEKLGRLEFVYLGGNRINDFNDLDKFAELPKLKTLFLSNNPIIRKNFYRQVVIRKLPQLALLDGKEITPEELERVEQMFSQEPKPQGIILTSTTATLPVVTVPPPVSKVPVKMNAVNFESVFGTFKDSATPGTSSGLEESKGRRPISTKVADTATKSGTANIAAQGGNKLTAILDLLAVKPSAAAHHPASKPVPGGKKPSAKGYPIHK